MKFRQNAALIGLAILSGCSKSAPSAEREGAPLDAVRVAMPATEPMPGPRDVDAKPAWIAAAGGTTARYGYPGEGPQLSLECRAGVLVVSRHVAAEVAAEALFALQGAGHILRLPVAATAVPGLRGYLWQGTIAPDDPGVLVFESAFNGTLPGGGRIEVSAGDAPREVIRRCKATPATAAPTSTATPD